jgi:hypothetical protein
MIMRAISMLAKNDRNKRSLFYATFWRSMKEEAEASPTIEDHSIHAEE